MTNVVDLDVITTLDLPPDKMLAKAKGKLDDVIIIGVDKEGDLYFSASKADGGNALWLLEKAKQALLEL